MHVSRLESGTNASEHLLTRIKRVLSGEDFSSKGYEFDVVEDSHSNWEVSYVFHPTRVTGDRVFCNFEKNYDGYLIHCDAVGSDSRASEDADHLITAFNTCIYTLGDLSSVQAIYKSLNKTIKKNREIWRDKPSALLFRLHEGTNRIEFINAGMPKPLLLKGTGKILGEYNHKTWPPIGNLRKQEKYTVDFLDLEPGDIFITFSDGFIANFNKFADVKLSKQIESLSRFQKGSTRSLLMRLMKNFGYNIQYQDLSDDISCLMIRNLG